jgi:peptide/nickel transport system permease protein
MLAYILRRLILMIPVLLIVGTVVFTLVHLTPGDPAAVILGPDATGEDVEELRDRLGLNDPLYEQYVRWLGGVVRLDFGESLFIGEPVTQALIDRAQPTLTLTFYALVLEIIIGIPAGVLAAVRHNSILDRVIMMGSISGAAMPNFFLGILLILIFAVQFGVLPSGRYVPLTDDPVEHLRHMLLPAFALGVSAAGLLARLVRSAMLDVLHEDYVRTAKAKGLPERLVIARHALRNALIPAITVIGLSVGGLLGGAVVTETVFTLPGMGRLIVQSVGRRDYPVIQGGVMVIAAIYVLINLLVDLLYMYLDPRVRYGDN